LVPHYRTLGAGSQSAQKAMVGMAKVFDDEGSDIDRTLFSVWFSS
jgi:hypothetical protein